MRVFLRGIGGAAASLHFQRRYERYLYREGAKRLESIILLVSRG
jgi:hypothetical protein